MKQQERLFLEGGSGRIECVVDLPLPHLSVRGVALVCHPHPLFGGSLDNKVAQTLARCCAQQGFYTLRPNFRGVGQSSGIHDNGVGELEDMKRVLSWLKEFAPINKEDASTQMVLAGFSFGSMIISRLVQESPYQSADKIILAGAPPGRWSMPFVPEHSFFIHGEKDDVAPLSDLMNWLEPQHLGALVVPGCDHFFNKKLLVLKRYVDLYLQH
jgi:alpha/beta superfamily hydrolase